jgi:hypothetical protein
VRGKRIGLVSAGLLVFVVAIFALSYWANPDKEVTVAIVATVGTIMASVLTVALTSYDAKTRELEESHRIPKTEVYGKLSDLVLSIFTLIKIPERADLNEADKLTLRAKLQAQLEEDFLSVSKKLLVWGSPRVIQAWLRFRAYSRVVAAQPEQNLEDALHNFLYMDDIFRAVREDLGLSSHELGEGELVKSFLADPEIIDRVAGRQARLAAHNPALHRTTTALSRGRRR